MIKKNVLILLFVFVLASIALAQELPPQATVGIKTQGPAKDKH